MLAVGNENLLAEDAVAAIRLWLGSRASVARWHRAVFASALVVLGAIVIGPSALNLWRFDRIVSQTDNRVVVAEWFERHVSAGSSVLQSGSGYGLPQLPRRLGYVEWVWNRRERRFNVNGRPAEGHPDWIVLQQSPLPSATQKQVTELLAGDYVLVNAFKAASLKDGLVYDQQDMFYVPFSGLPYVTRPGPNFTLYARRDVAFHAQLHPAAP